MIKKKSGQTALILILVTAAALIFLAISLNWGRIAQTKALMTVAADQSASTLASDAASYGEMQKQTYLQNTNQLTELGGILLSIIMVIIAVIALFIPGLQGLALFLAYAAVAMAVINLVLQLVVVQPMITSLWNKLQKDQPVQQQFYEGGITTALQGAVGDQVNITDYFDWNADGVYGKASNGAPNETVGRFAVFYTDRLKMLHQPPIPQVVFFYNQLAELMNGETCSQNESDHQSYPGVIALNPACLEINSSPTYCINNPIDAACQAKIPNGFQLNDACAGVDPTNMATYNPYCDPCCQVLSVPDPLYSATNPNPLHPTPNKQVRPVSCPTDTSASGAPAQCLTNNPYGGSSSQYTLLYDPAFQNYPAGVSFLAQFGRDQQMGPFTTNLTPQGNSNNGTYFPNGIYPFFWLTDEYSLEVDNIDPTKLQSSQVHWCAAGGSIPSSGNAPIGFSDLAQLSLPYSCQGQDCCVNYLPESVTGGVPTPPSSGTPYWLIDMVGSPSFGSNPGLDPSFGGSDSASWLPGDNQMCSTAWPYNGANSTFQDGTCEWTGSTTAPPPPSPPLVEPPSTLDALDDTMHTLSDFVKFADVFLNNDTGTLSSTFKTWYPQVADWIDPSTGRLPPLVANLSGFNAVISNWLNQTYTSANAWCVPSETTLLNGNSSTAEDTYINTNSGTTTWGDLPHVMACLNYNSNQDPAVGSVYNYQQCGHLMNTSCPGSPTGTVCDPKVLGRSLAGAAPAYDGCAGNYAAWVNNSLILATDEAPKFAVRAQFLKDIYTRARTMQTIFTAGDAALKQFLLPCSGADCANGGPSAQLTYANSQPEPTALLPNSVIYGWVDNTYPNGHPGYAHIVKVTAYAPGRAGGSNLALSLLPWIKTSTSLFTRSYTLMARDGYVYVGVKRWDEDHSNSILFPNGRPLWQFMFHNPAGTTTTGQGLMQACNGVTLPGGAAIGFGLEPQTVAGLGFSNISSADQTALANAFMLNDKGDGKIDPYAKSGSGYSACLWAADQLLANAPESHACAQYIASANASGPSGNGDHDYSLKFVDCKSVSGYPPPEDL